VNKSLIILLSFLIIANCSLDTKTGIWSKNEEIEIVKKTKAKKKELFKKEKALEKEFNPNLKIKLTAKLINNSFKNDFDNNNGRINYNGNLKKSSRFKFSKIDNFDQFEPEIVFDKNNIIFFDNNGSILKFNNLSKLIWKKNYYTKQEKKQKPILFFANNNNHLIIADSIAKYYALNINTGELLWSKNNMSSFNSQLKIYKEKFFVVDSENILRCYSLKDGNQIWKVKTDKSFISSQKKLSLVIIDNKVFFNNSIGDISAVDINSGNLLWQMPTQSSAIYEDSFFLKTSELIANKNSILLSNNKNEFFSINIKTGILNWQQKINSNLRSTLVDDLIFSISMEGYLVITNNNSGSIIRITDVFKEFKEKVRKKIKPSGFIVGSDNIYLTTNTGKLLVIDIATGKTTKVLKIDNEKISRPFVLNQNLFIIKKNSIIKLD